jgi:hypothetical protein
MRNDYILVEKLDGKRPFGRPRRRCRDNIRMDLGDIECDGVDWIHLTLDRDYWWALVDHDNEASSSIKRRQILN